MTINNPDYVKAVRDMSDEQLDTFLMAVQAVYAYMIDDETRSAEEMDGSSEQHIYDELVQINKSMGLGDPYVEERAGSWVHVATDGSEADGYDTRAEALSDN